MWRRITESVFMPIVALLLFLAVSLILFSGMDTDQEEDLITKLLEVECKDAEGNRSFYYKGEGPVRVNVRVSPMNFYIGDTDEVKLTFQMAEGTSCTYVDIIAEPDSVAELQNSKVRQ